VPVMLVQLGGNLWQPQKFLTAIVQYLRHRHPFWNRTRGADHVFFTTQDKGGCWVPQELSASIVISYFGFTAPMMFFGHEDRLLAARQGRLKYRYAWARRKYNLSQAACFNPSKDVVVPVDFRVPRVNANMTTHIHAAAVTMEGSGNRGRSPSSTCETQRNDRSNLLFMSGSVRNVLPEYSQGVRQAFYRLHRNTPGVTYHIGQWSISELADSTFCLAPSGWGYGWRTYLALAVQCIPVIVQPYVQQAFEDLLPYASFSLRISPDELQGLPDRLRAMPRSRICSMRAAGARYFRAVLWQQPEGIAYDMLQLSLCRRAIGVLTRHRPGASLPRWAGCANVTAEQLLDRL